MQGDTMEILNVRKKTSTEIVFATIGDMTTFFDEVLSGKDVIFKHVDGSIESGEYVNSNIMSDISDNKISIKSEETK